MSLDRVNLEFQDVRRRVKSGDAGPDELLSAWKSLTCEYRTNTESAARAIIPLAADLCAENPDISDQIFAEALRPLYALGIDGWEQTTAFIKQLTPPFLLSFLPQSISRRGSKFLRDLVTDRDRMVSSMQIMYDAEKIEWALADLGEPPIPTLIRNDTNAG